MRNYLLQTSHIKNCIYFSIVSLFIITTQLYAANISVVSPTDILPGDPPTDITSANIPFAGSAGDFIGNIIAQFIGLVAVLTILAVTWAGVQMVLAIGEEEKMKKARHTMIYAFIGL